MLLTETSTPTAGAVARNYLAVSVRLEIERCCPLAPALTSEWTPILRASPVNAKILMQAPTTLRAFAIWLDRG